MNNLKKIVLLFISTYGCYAQNFKISNQYSFYIVDTIEIKNPIIYYKIDQSVKFVTNEDNINQNKPNINKIILKDDNYILGEDIYRFFTDNNIMKNYYYPDNGNCQKKNAPMKNHKKIRFQKFTTEPSKYILALIKLSFYNSLVTAYGLKESAFDKSQDVLYYKIVFPLCETRPK